MTIDSMLAPADATITFKDAVKQYAGSSTPALDGLSMSVEGGHLVCLVGPSGGGKTTALMLVNRLIELTSGQVTIGQDDISTIDEIELRRTIGYVIQGAGLFPHMTVAQNIAIVPSVLKWPSAKTSERVNEMLHLVGLEPRDYLNRYPGQLSGGQQQRVGIARALAADPPVMLMDEPFGALDPITRERMQDEFLTLHREIGKTTVFVTHDIDEAVKMSDKIAVLKPGGRLAQYDVPHQILTDPADAFVASFVGQDRGLKLLSLVGVLEVAHGSSHDGDPAWPTVGPDCSAHIALSELLAAGHDGVRVISEDGTDHGIVTMADLARIRRDERPAAVRGSVSGGGDR